MLEKRVLPPPRRHLRQYGRPAKLTMIDVLERKE